LYNWYTVADSRNIAPVGWHVPSETEWEVLRTFLGNNVNSGGNLKESGLLHWISPNANATNSTGFTALPAGIRPYGQFVLVGYKTFWLSSTEDDTYNSALFFGVYYNFGNIDVLNEGKYFGGSIRCIKD